MFWLSSVAGRSPPGDSCHGPTAPEIEIDQEVNVDRRRFFAAAAVAAAAVPNFVKAQESEDAEFQQYIGSITAVTSMMSWFFDEVSRLTTTATEADYVNVNWQIDVLGAFSVASAAQEYLATVEPPVLFTETHGYLVESVDEVVESGEYMRAGVLNLDLDALTLATESMVRASELIVLANDAMPFQP